MTNRTTTKLNSPIRKPLRKRSLLSSAIAIHVAALVVAIITNNPVESVARTSNVPVVQPPAVKEEAPLKGTILESSYSGSDYDDWIDDLSPTSDGDPFAGEMDEQMFSTPAARSDESELDSELLNSDSSFSTAN